MEKKVRISPDACASHDEEKYIFEIELPGVDKKDVEIEASNNSFCLKGSRGDVEYSACYSLAHDVDPDKAKAKHKDGILTVELPFKSPIKTAKIKVE